METPPKLLKRAISTNTSTQPNVLLDARFRKTNLGGDRCRYELAKHLVEQKIPNITFLLHDSLRDQIECERTITTHHTPNQHPGSDIFEHYTLPMTARRRSIDIYHGTFNVLPLIKTAPLEIVTIHDMAVFAFPQAYSTKFAYYMQFLIAKSIVKATKIITVSDATKREILRYYPGHENKIVTILNGVGLEFIEARKIPKPELEAVKSKYKIDQPYVLFVGNLERKKNLSNLIQAFAQYHRNSEQKCKLVIVGKPLDRGPDGGFTITKEMDFIHFTGYVDEADLPSLYRAADLIAYPSLYEGFGMPVAEGMAAGVPVLTSTISSLPEVAAGAAMLVDPTSVDDIATGIHKALTDENWRRQAVEKGILRAEYLSWERNAQLTAELYTSVWNSSQ